MDIFRKTILVIPLGFLVILLACEIDTKIAVSKENPPKITFSGSGGIYRLFVTGPYSQEEINLLLNRKNLLSKEEAKQLENAIPGDRKLWELDPVNVKTNLSNIPPITYGIVSEEFKQIYPKDNEQPPPLLEGKYYQASAPSYSANDRVTTFIIQNNEAITVER
jgi:hypothetical protein